MAALIPKSIQIATRQTLYGAAASIQICHYSQKPRIIKNPTTASLKRGTGGRSSFNGIVCTVFGSTGAMGSFVCNKLGKTGTQLILPYRGDHCDALPLKLVGDLGQVLFHPFHLCDEDSIRRSIKHSNVVINLVGRAWETRNFTFDDVNVKGPRRIARLCKEMGVERLIHLSALNAHPNPEPILVEGGSRFYKSKWEGEWAVKEEFPEATIIRPAVCIGQEDRFSNLYGCSWRRSYCHRMIALKDKGENVIKQPVWMSDVARGIVACVNDPSTAGRTYQFVGARAYKLADLVTWLLKLIHVQEEENIGVKDLKYAMIFKLRLAITEMLSVTFPWGGMYWEGLEIEHTSDKIIKGVPTLDDLGIKPEILEDQMPWLMKKHQQTKPCSDFIDCDPPPPAPYTSPIIVSGVC